MRRGVPMACTSRLLARQRLGPLACVCALVAGGLLCASTILPGHSMPVFWSGARLAVSVLMAGMLGLILWPRSRACTVLGLPTAGLARSCIGAGLLLGLVAQGLPFASAWLIPPASARAVPEALDRPGLWPLLLTACGLMLVTFAVAHGRGLIRTGRSSRTLRIHLLGCLGLVACGVAERFALDSAFGPLRGPDVLFWAMLFFLGVPNLYLLRPPQEGHCSVCDYDLNGNVSGRCPECGTPIAAGTEAAEAPEVKNAG